MRRVRSVLRRAREDTLIFSFLGMENVSIVVGAQSVINVVMQEKPSSLEEVTVVAFSRQKKGERRGFDYDD